MFELPDDDDNFWEDLPIDDITNSKSPKHKAASSNVPQHCEIQSDGTSRTANCNQDKQKPSGRSKNVALGDSQGTCINNSGDLFISRSGEDAAKNNCILGVENTPKTNFTFKPVSTTNCDSVSLDELEVNRAENGEPKTGKRLSSESIAESSKKIRLHEENRSDYQQDFADRTYQLRTNHPQRHTLQTSSTPSPSPVEQCNPQLRTSHPQVIASARRQSSGVTRNINTTPVIKKAKRKFPGPAGLLPKLSGNSESIKESVTPSLKISPDKITVEKEDTILSSQSTDDIFSEEPWRRLMEELGTDGQQLLHNFSITNNLTKARKKQLHRGKVPLLMCVIDNIDWHGSDLSVSLKDRSGEVQGTVHRDIMKEYESELQVGSALVLRQVSVISPNPRSHYLNITPANIVFIYSKNGDSCQLVNTRNTSLSSVLEEVQRQESSQRHLMHQSATAKTPSRSLAQTQQFQTRTPQFVGRSSTPNISQRNNRTHSFGGRPSTPFTPQMNNRTAQFAGRPATPNNSQMSNSAPRFGGRTMTSGVRTPLTVFDRGNPSTSAPFNSQSVRTPTPVLQHAESRTPSIQTANRNIQSVPYATSATSTSVPPSNSHFQGTHSLNQSGSTLVSNQTRGHQNSTVEYNKNQTTVNQTANVSSIPSSVPLRSFGNNSQEVNKNQQCTPNRRSFKFKSSRTPENQSITNNNSSSVSSRATKAFTPSLHTSAYQTSNNSASLLSDKPKFEVDSVWGEDLSDDVLSQLSEEF